jgi:HAD domain in Swiss Army Knife RNA repair proteins
VALDGQNYELLTLPATQPLLLVDVDGVLSLFGLRSPPSEATIGALVDGVPHLFSRAAAHALSELSRTIQCVWCTGWEEKADEHLPWLLGLPAGWPHIPLARATGPGSSTAGHWKLAAIDAYAGPQRPLAWVDDALDAECHDWAGARSAPTLLVATDPAVGLTAAHAARIAAWAAALSS